MSLSITVYGLGAVRQAARARHLHPAPLPSAGRLAADPLPAAAARPASPRGRILSVLAGGVLAAALSMGAAGPAGAAAGGVDAGA